MADMKILSPIDTNSASTVPSNVAFELRATIVPDSDQAGEALAVLHWVQGQALFHAIKAAQCKSGGGEKVKGKSTRAMNGVLDILREFPDMLISVGKSGDLTIWGVQGLTGRPQRVAKVAVILKSQTSAMCGDFDAFFGTSMVFYDSMTVEESGKV
ncbi:hypothetical protein HDU84_000559 [Entophlyctis sp. JEL0112]|nr:hypothetical protein HDU84_000559 [Entophlyctis sp. JEL0112]